MGITQAIDSNGVAILQIFGRDYVRLKSLQDEYELVGKKTSFFVLDIRQGTFLMTVPK